MIANMGFFGYNKNKSKKGEFYGSEKRMGNHNSGWQHTHHQ